MVSYVVSDLQCLLWGVAILHASSIINATRLKKHRFKLGIHVIDRAIDAN